MAVLGFVAVVLWVTRLRGENLAPMLFLGELGIFGYAVGCLFSFFFMCYDRGAYGSIGVSVRENDCWLSTVCDSICCFYLLARLASFRLKMASSRVTEKGDTARYYMFIVPDSRCFVYCVVKFWMALVVRWRLFISPPCEASAGDRVSCGRRMLKLSPSSSTSIDSTSPAPI